MFTYSRQNPVKYGCKNTSFFPNRNIFFEKSSNRMLVLIVFKNKNLSNPFFCCFFMRLIIKYV